jgi:hypothetical protein
MNTRLIHAGWLLIACCLFAPRSFAAPFFEQIEDLRSDADYVAYLQGIGEFQGAQFRAELENMLAAARTDLQGAEREQEELKKHVNALSKLASQFERIDQFQSFGEVKILQFETDDDSCTIADPSMPTHTVFDCDAEYRYAIDIWRRTVAVNKLLNTWKSGARSYSLAQIRDSELRWTNFSEKVTSDQFVWETLVNGWIFEGTLSTPPRKQLRLLHPVALMSYARDSGKFEPELGIDVLGLRTYGENYDPEWGLSIFALLESGNAEDTGWGINLAFENFTLGVVRQDTADKVDETKIILGYNLAGLFANKRNELAERKRELLDGLDQFKADLQSIR